MLKRLLVTGAAGGMGQAIRPRLAQLAHRVRLSDVTDLGEAADHEEIVPGDLADAEAVDVLMADCDGVLHLGGVSGNSPGRAFSRRTSSAPNTCTRWRVGTAGRASCSRVPTARSASIRGPRAWIAGYRTAPTPCTASRSASGRTWPASTPGQCRAMARGTRGRGGGGRSGGPDGGLPGGRVRGLRSSRRLMPTRSFEYVASREISSP